MLPFKETPNNLTERVGDLFPKVGRRDQALLLLILLNERSTLSLLRLQAKVGRGARRLAESMILEPLPLIEATGVQDLEGDRTLPDQVSNLSLTSSGKVLLSLTRPLNEKAFRALGEEIE